MPSAFARILWASFIPILYFISTFILFFIFTIAKFIKKDKMQFLVGKIFLFIFIQPNILGILFSMSSCTKIGDQEYISGDMRYKCNTQLHFLYIFLMFLPLIIIWMIVLPMNFLKTLYKDRSSLLKLRVISRLGFFYEVFKLDYFYWEFVRIYFRISIVIVITFFESNYSKLIIVYFLILIYICF